MPKGVWREKAERLAGWFVEAGLQRLLGTLSSDVEGAGLGCQDIDLGISPPEPSPAGPGEPAPAPPDPVEMDLWEAAG